MTVDHLFLGWDRPCLHATVDELVLRIGREGILDLENLIVVLPGARAGRRLIELLVERAERDGLRLVPPLTGTPGALPEWLYEPARPTAGDVGRLLAWVAALRAADRDAMAKVFPRRPAENDFEGWVTLAGLCERLHAELAGDLLTFADVATRGSELPDFNEQDRWQALETVRRLYVARLGELGMADRHEARIEAVKNRKCRTEKSIVLLATPELNGVGRGMLEQVAERVSVWTFAPQDRAEWFDEFGCTRVEPWQKATIELRDEQIEIVERPSDQAAAVLRAIAGFDRRHAAVQITVGVPDEEVVRYVEQQFEQCGLVAHHAAGLSLARTGLFRLLQVAADFAEGRRTNDFAMLVRHPAVEEWLHADTTKQDWITELDKFSSDHLRATLRPESFDSLAPESPLRRALGRVEEWLKVMHGTRPLADWAEPIQELLLTVYGIRPLNRNKPRDRIVIETCDKVHEFLRQFFTLDERSRPQVDAATALGLVLRMVEGELIPLPPRRDSIDLLGWLELPLDDAPALVVTGFNEGFVPDSINSDAFLPNRLRQHLGLLDNDRRYARDAYALSAILASRPDVRLIAGRRSGNFEPLTPSRLLFACDDELIARRIRRFFPETLECGGSTPLWSGIETNPSGTEPEIRTIQSGVEPPHSKGRAPASRFEIPRPQPLAKPITSMRVTSFRDYLACPYRFYLRHVLGLKAIEPQAELDPLGFGSLAHDVLQRFGSDPIRDSADADTVRNFLNAQLDEMAAEKYGPDALPAVRVQVEQLRLRLDAFARIQAQRRAAGWKIELTERDFKGDRTALVVDGEPMLLRGRIDRIDRHERTGACCVLDYKTSEDGAKPERTHVTAGRWKDLQLPLYRHLVRADGIADEVTLGYIVLPRDPSKVEFLLAEWTPEDMASADDAACDVIRGVRRGDFKGPTEPPPRGFDEFAWICQEGRTAPRMDEADEEDAA